MDTTPQGTVSDTTPVATPQGNDEVQDKIEALEKQRRDQQSYYMKQLSEHEKLLQREYSEDPSKIHTIEDASMRDKLTKLIYPELANSPAPYDEARTAGKLLSRFEVDERIKTDKVKSMFSVAKQYDSTLSSAESEEKFYQFYDATNPRLSAEERFALAMEIARVRFGTQSQGAVQAPAPESTTPSYAPPAPIAPEASGQLTEEQIREKARKTFA